MTLILLFIIVLLLLIYRKKSRPYYISFFILSLFSFTLIQVNPDLHEEYNLLQIIYLIDSIDFILYKILNLVIAVLLILIIFNRTEKNSLRILFSCLAILATIFIFFTMIILQLFIIKEPLKNHFEGYVYSNAKKPLSGVKIIEGTSTNNYVLTDKKGFFKLKRKIKINSESNLIFTRKEYKDTTVQIQSRYDHSPRTFYLFLRREPDTLIMTNY